MQTVGALGLRPGDYRLVPSETMRDWDGRLKDLVTGNWDAIADTDEFHRFTVERTDGSPVVEVVQKRVAGGEQEIAGISFQDVRELFLFRPPGGDPKLVVEVERAGWNYGYTIADPEAEKVLATVEKTGRFFGDWQLKDAAGDVRATAGRVSYVRRLFSDLPTHTASTPDGTEVARMDIGRGGGSFTSMALYQMAVTVSRSPIPAEIALGFAFAVFHQAKQADSSGSSANRGP